MTREFSVAFDGSILERGFWIYVWEIKHGRKKYYYVGRTGDNSSANAASPFSRLSLHLDVRDKATANCIVRHIRKINLEPSACKYEMFAIGPLFQEQADFELHKPFRDVVGLLEAELAAHLKSHNFFVLGSHPNQGEYDRKLFGTIKKRVNKKYGINC